MLETFRQLGVQASSTFSKIFDALNDYLNAPRKRPAIRHGMLTLGSGLGLCHHALSHFGKALMGRTDFVSISHCFACNTDHFSRRVLLAFTTWPLACWSN